MVLERSNNDKNVALLTRRTGPFRVTEVVGQDFYVIKDAEMRLPLLSYHANQMKLYKSRPQLSTVLKYYVKK